eukprot:5497117-Amphidinium_carterae.1
MHVLLCPIVIYAVDTLCSQERLAADHTKLRLSASPSASAGHAHKKSTVNAPMVMFCWTWHFAVDCSHVLSTEASHALSKWLTPKAYCWHRGLAFCAAGNSHERLPGTRVAAAPHDCLEEDFQERRRFQACNLLNIESGCCARLAICTPHCEASSASAEPLRPLRIEDLESSTFGIKCPPRSARDRGLLLVATSTSRNLQTVTWKRAVNLETQVGEKRTST